MFFLWMFAFPLLVYVQKEFPSYLYLFFRNSSSKIQRNLKEIYNKAISMIRGKSPMMDVEMSKKLNFVAAILDFWRPSWNDNGYLISPYFIYGNNHLYQFWYFYHKVNDRYANCHILPFIHNAYRKYYLQIIPLILNHF